MCESSPSLICRVGHERAAASTGPRPPTLWYSLPTVPPGPIAFLLSAEDVLVTCLSRCRNAIADLAGLRNFVGDEERADELEFVRQVLPPLAELYRGARQAGEIVVCEVL